MTNTKDLQIFLTRPPDWEPGEIFEAGGLSSLVSAPLNSGDARHRQSAEVERQGDIDRFQSYVAIANSDAVETIRLPFSVRQGLEFANALGSNRVHLQECIRFGSTLFEFLFHNSIRDLLRSLEVGEGTLRLTVATMLPELTMLPWELICDLRAGTLPRFLSCEPNIHLCRSLRLFNREAFEVQNLGKEGLRVLLATANPDDSPYLDVEKEEAQLRFIIDESPQLDGVELRILHGANINSLRDTINDFSPHIIHLSCHGAYDQREDFGFVLLCSPRDSRVADRVNAYRLASAISEGESVQLVMVSSCYGAFPGISHSLSGVAQCIHAAGVNDVVSLQFPLMDTTGHAIVINFYKYLLRDRLSVEESVAKVRRFLLVNGFMSPECFGLTLYQSNVSQFWPQATAVLRKSATESRDFLEIVELFESEARERIEVKVANDLSAIKASLQDLESLTTEDLLLANRNFGGFDVALKILRRAVSVSVPLSQFLQITRLASLLCHARFEGGYIATAFVIIVDPEEVPSSKTDPQVSQFLDSDFFLGERDEILPTAIKVNGTDRAFEIAYENLESEAQFFVRNLETFGEASDPLDRVSFGIDRWIKLAHLVKETGCALILPGDSRVKILLEGAQVAEYRQGKWLLSDFEGFQVKVMELADELEISQDLCLDLARKSVQASEQGRGITLILQCSDSVLERCSSGYFDVQGRDDLVELKKRKVYEFPADKYLDLVHGDNAVVISSDGLTIAFNANLAPAPSTRVKGLPKAGARHTSAQKITKEIDAVAFVVSEDGPITVFRGGEVVDRLFAS